ncbi:MAG: serine/threonine-protein kinase [Dokdonella sp.]
MLEGLRNEDSALHARLLKLLAVDASDSDLVADVSRWRDRVFSANDVEPMPALIGPWRIVRELGSGGMGRVFLADRIAGDYEQKVALKVIRGEFTSDAAVARFLTERRILARLEHPGIASLIDGDVDAAGRPWFAMQYVQGLSLPDYCTQHGLGLEGRLKLMIAVCNAVAYAHRQLVVHCDLKPSNVLVDDSGQPRLLDFGISRLIDAQGSEGQATLTQLRALTPGYAAPEQLAGQPVSVATDVYALGSMLYELLTGVRPYAQSDANAATVAIAQAQAHARAASRAAGAGAPVPARRLRGDLDLVVATALMHDPAQRYADAQALAEDLRSHVGGWPLRARRASPWYRARKFVGRHRVAAPLGALAVTALLLVTAFALTQTHVAREQASRAEAVRQFLVGVFDQASPDENQGRPISAHQLLKKRRTPTRPHAGRPGRIEIRNGRTARRTLYRRRRLSTFAGADRSRHTGAFECQGPRRSSCSHPAQQGMDRE